eukprot:9849640-Heterocapsa_arctica.AAC.1
MRCVFRTQRSEVNKADDQEASATVLRAQKVLEDFYKDAARVPTQRVTEYAWASCTSGSP